MGNAGHIFTPEISEKFHRLIAITMHGQDAAHIHTSLKHAEPVRPRIRVNGAYPDGVPLQSTPPTLFLWRWKKVSLKPGIDFSSFRVLIGMAIGEFLWFEEHSDCGRLLAKRISPAYCQEASARRRLDTPLESVAPIVFDIRPTLGTRTHQLMYKFLSTPY